MPATLNPFGLQPVRTIQPVTTNFMANSQYLITYNNTNTMGQGDLVIASAGFVTSQAAYNSAPVLGVFCQTSYQPVVQPLTPNYQVQWLAVAGLASTATVNAWIWDSREIVFRIQANGTVVQSDIGLNATIVANANASNGYSQMSLDVVTHQPAATSTYPLRIVGVWQGVNNAITDAYPILEVMLNYSNLGSTTGQ